MFLHMLMPSAQRWANNHAAGVSPPPPHVLTTRHQLAEIALMSPSKTWEYVV